MSETTAASVGRNPALGDNFSRQNRGVVHLVGAGPGDPLLLTRRAARLLAGADVVVVDRRSLDAIADLAPPAAERCFVGRTPAGPAWETGPIVDLLAERASRGLEVVRLKSGDPFVCSRGGEERQALLERGVECDVVPGVTAATAAPLAAGSSRGRSVTILAGNDDPSYPPLDLGTLADPTASLVVLTGRSRQGAIAAALVDAGLDPVTPAAIVSAANRAEERVVTVALGDLGRTRLPPPATLVIGPTSPGERHAHP
jgi:siroheme synthase